MGAVYLEGAVKLVIELALFTLHKNRIYFAKSDLLISGLSTIASWCIKVFNAFLQILKNAH